MTAADLVALGPTRCAALIAPVVDRVFASAMLAGRHGGGGEVSARFGGSAAVGLLVEFRTRLARPGGTVDPAGFAAVGRYRDADQRARLLDQHLANGMLRRTADGGFAATERGREFLGEISAVYDRVLAQMWQDHAARVERLLDVVGRLVQAGLASGGPAFTTMAPPYEPPVATAGTRLLNRLGTLRYHRADAHAAAWAAAGHTARTIVELAPGPERQAIETETNRLAAPPFASLPPDERLLLLADLAALPGPLPR